MDIVPNSDDLHFSTANKRWNVPPAYFTIEQWVKNTETAIDNAPYYLPIQFKGGLTKKCLYKQYLSS